MPSWVSTNLISLLIFIGLVGATGRAGGPMGRRAVVCESCTSPNWLFGPAWIPAFAVAAWPVNQWASLLFIAYLLWVSFAAALNASIWLRNPATA